MFPLWFDEPIGLLAAAWRPGRLDPVLFDEFGDAASHRAVVDAEGGAEFSYRRAPLRRCRGVAFGSWLQHNGVGAKSNLRPDRVGRRKPGSRDDAATAAEIEQAIWNADRMFRHRQYPDRVLFRSATDGGRRLVVVAQIVRDGVRPITAWEEE